MCSTETLLPCYILPVILLFILVVQVIASCRTPFKWKEQSASCRMWRSWLTRHNDYEDIIIVCLMKTENVWQNLLRLSDKLSDGSSYFFMNTVLWFVNECGVDWPWPSTSLLLFVVLLYWYEIFICDILWQCFDIHMVKFLCVYICESFNHI